MSKNNGNREPTHTAFEGRVKFHMTYYSPLVYQEHARIESALADAPHQDKFKVADFAMYLTLTQRIDFDFQGNEGPILTDFKTWWEGIPTRRENKLDEIWLGYIYLASTILLEWMNASRKALAPYIDPVTSPLELLEIEDAREAQREDSPLEQNESLGATAS